MTRALPLLAAFLGAFLATLWLVGSLYRGRRPIPAPGWVEPYVDDEGLFV